MAFVGFVSLVDTPQPDDEVKGLKALAIEVLLKAFEDLTIKTPTTLGGGSADKVKYSAKTFLCQKNEDLEFWCKLAGMDMDAVVERAVKKCEQLASVQIQETSQAAV